MALTRAKNWLYVCYPLRYYWPGRSDQHSFAQRTRFLPDKVLECFEQCVTDPLGDDDDEFDDDAAPASPAARVRRRTKDLWGSEIVGSRNGRVSQSAASPTIQADRESIGDESCTNAILKLRIAGGSQWLPTSTFRGTRIDKSQRVVQEGNGLVVDLAEDDRPIGIEILFAATRFVGHDQRGSWQVRFAALGSPRDGPVGSGGRPNQRNCPRDASLPGFDQQDWNPFVPHDASALTGARRTHLPLQAKDSLPESFQRHPRPQVPKTCSTASRRPRMIGFP